MLKPIDPEQLYSHVEIAQRFGVNRTTVMRRLRKLRVPVVKEMGDPRVRGVHIIALIENSEADSIREMSDTDAAPPKRPVGRPRKTAVGGGRP